LNVKLLKQNNDNCQYILDIYLQLNAFVA